jgi:membrane-bound lytic murein transglycosylase A
LRRALALVALIVLSTEAGAGPPGLPEIPGLPVSFSVLPGFEADDHRAALATFRVSCAAVVGDAKPLRAALPYPPALKTVCARALALPRDLDDQAARLFLETAFEPRQVPPADPAGSAFFTGYYEPLVEGSLVRTGDFSTPLYGRPADLVGVPQGGTVPGLDGTLSAGRRLADGHIVAMPDRAAIEGGALARDAKPLVWLKEPVDAFFVQVQGSARIRLPDGALRRLVYDGRNGYPYTSIGKVLVETLHIPPAAMGMAQLKAWIRANGQGRGEAGTALMQKNRSYIFFRFDDTLAPDAGPIGGAGVSLTPLRSLAIDRTVWPYGLPFFVDASLPWDGEQSSPFRRVLIGQDTGSAILGPARGDIFFGTGEAAASRAGAIRDHGTLYVLWPKASP